MKPEIDLKTLYYFTVLAQEKHFGLAAKRIGIEQPPLSLQIQKLEKKTGGKLFDRSNRRIKLTETGEALLPQAQQLLAASQKTLEHLRRMNRGEAGVITLGYTSSTIFCGIPEIIQQHQEKFPHVAFALRELAPAAQLEGLVNGTLDVGFIREPSVVAGIQTRYVLEENFVAALSQLHPLAHRKSLMVPELAAEPFILFPKPIAPTLYDKVWDIFARAGVFPTIKQEANEWQTIVNLVAANLGVTICPSSFRKLQIGQITYLPLQGVARKTGVSLCVHQGNTSKLLVPFLELAAQALSSQPG